MASFTFSNVMAEDDLGGGGNSLIVDGMEMVDPIRDRLDSLSPVLDRPAITLHKAARDGRIKEVDGWMQYFRQHYTKSPPINERDERGYTAFHYATKYNHLQIMKTLVDHKADPKLRTKAGNYTALHLAAHYKVSTVQVDLGSPETFTNKEAMDFLVEEKHKLDVNAKAQFDTYPLHVACSRGNKAAVEALIEHKDIKLNLLDANKDSILHEACTNDNVDLLESLLKKLEKEKLLEHLLTMKNDTDHTPLHVACAYGQPRMAHVLLKHEAAQPKRFDKYPPLLLACSHKREDVVCRFLEIVEMDLFSRRRDGATVLHLVAERGWSEAATCIISNPAARKMLHWQDRFNKTPLHYAATRNNSEIIRLLVQKGAKVDTLDIYERTPLLVAASMGNLISFTTLRDLRADMTKTDFNRKSVVHLAAEHNHHGILKVVSADSILVDYAGNTPLHAAAANGSEKALKILLNLEDTPGRDYPDCDIDVNPRNSYKQTPLHLAAEHGHNGCVKILFDSELGVDVTAEDDDCNTALHLAASRGHYNVAVTLLNNYADVTARNFILWTPLDCAANGGHHQLVDLLILKKAEVDSKDKLQETPLHLAAKHGHVQVVETLMKHNADITAVNSHGANALDLAIEHGQTPVAMTIVKSDCWRDALRNTTPLPQERYKQTTPMRKLIKKMPEVAFEVLNRCTTTNNISPDHIDYTVTFDYEFLEDFSPKPKPTNKLKRFIPSRVQKFHSRLSKMRPSVLVTKLAKKLGKSSEYTAVSGQDDHWGPVGGFDKDNHPLNIMVESMQTKLLDHPLVSSLLAYKWSKAWRFYLINILFYLVFLAFLTAFALELPNPQSELCLAVSNNTFGSANGTIGCSTGENTTVECGECGAREKFLDAAGIIVLVCVVLRLIMEFFQFLQLHLQYFVSFENWLEVLLYCLCLTFISALLKTCVCPAQWQWQIGALAVFLAWIHLCIFIRKLPQFGLYIVMFQDIVETFIKVTIPAFLLVLAFSMAFYMMFFVPNVLFSSSPFATPGLSIIKTMTMAVGEMDFETIFRFSSEGVPTAADLPDPIPYAGVSLLLWIFFLIAMPILLMNLLTSLAVDDVGQIRSNAEHRKLALQIDLVLTTEEAFQVFREWFHKRKHEIKPNKHSQSFKRIRSAVWAGVDENFTADNIVTTLNKSPSEPIEHVQQQTAALLQEITKLRAALKTIYRRNYRTEVLVNRLAVERKIDVAVEEEDDDWLV